MFIFWHNYLFFIWSLSLLYKGTFTTEINRSEQISTINTNLFQKPNWGLLWRSWALKQLATPQMSLCCTILHIGTLLAPEGLYYLLEMPCPQNVCRRTLEGLGPWEGPIQKKKNRGNFFKRICLFFLDKIFFIHVLSFTLHIIVPIWNNIIY